MALRPKIVKSFYLTKTIIIFMGIKLLKQPRKQ